MSTHLTTVRDESLCRIAVTSPTLSDATVPSSTPLRAIRSPTSTGIHVDPTAMGIPSYAPVPPCRGLRQPRTGAIGEPSDSGAGLVASEVLVQQDRVGGHLQQVLLQQELVLGLSAHDREGHVDPGRYAEGEAGLFGDGVAGDRVQVAQQQLAELSPAAAGGPGGGPLDVAENLTGLAQHAGADGLHRPGLARLPPERPVQIVDAVLVVAGHLTQFA